MSFEQDGFLSQIEESRVAQIHEHHASWFSLVNRLNRLAMSVLLRDVPKLPEELYVATLYARAVSMFQGAVVLAKRGMAAEARTLVRGCAETAIAIGCVRREPAFLSKLDEDYDKHRVAAANDLLKLPKADPNLSAEQREALRHVIAEVGREYQSPHPLRINWADAAITAGMTDLYLTVYRQTSVDAAHVSLNALDRHVASDASGSIVGLRFHPEFESIDDTLSAAIAGLTHATEATLHLRTDSAEYAELGAVVSQWNTLIAAPQGTAEAKSHPAPP